MPLQIIGPQFSNFVRSVQLCCEEKGLSYSLGMNLDGQPLTLPDIKSMHLHPFGKIPVLLHDGQRIFETASICRYLDAAFTDSPLQPSKPWERAEVDQWSAAISIYADRVLIRRVVLSVISPRNPERPPNWEAVAQAEPEAREVLGVLSKQLGQRRFICGHQFSIADALLAPMLDHLQRVTKILDDFPALMAYLTDLRERPSGSKVLVRPVFT